MIRIWKFAAAPQDLRDLYSEGSLETWVLEAPSEEAADAELLLTPQGDTVKQMARFTLPDGRLVCFGQLPGAPRAE